VAGGFLLTCSYQLIIVDIPAIIGNNRRDIFLYSVHPLQHPVRLVIGQLFAARNPLFCFSQLGAERIIQKDAII